MLDDWLSLYEEYCQPHEAPDAFHTWIGLSLVAACLERRVWLTWGNDDENPFMVYPHQYIMVVALSGLCRKTAAIAISERLMGKLESPLPVWAEQGSKESMVSFMAGQETAAVYLILPELTGFLDANAQRSGFLQMLTRLYDSPDIYTRSTITRGKELLEAVCVNMLAATTPDEMKAALPQAALTGGFLARVILVQGEAPRKMNPMPVFDKRLRSLLIGRLEEIRALTGPCAMDKEATAHYSLWYKSIISSAPDADSFIARKHTHVLKVAMALAACRGQLTITHDCIVRAISLVEATVNGRSEIAKSIQTTQTGESGNVVLAAITRRGADGISRTDLMRSMSYRMNAKELNDVIVTLSGAGLIKQQTVGPRKGIHYVGGEF